MTKTFKGKSYVVHGVAKGEAGRIQFLCPIL